MEYDAIWLWLKIISSFQPYDFLALIPVIEGAGGVITDWKGHQLQWEASPNSHATSMHFISETNLSDLAFYHHLLD